MKSKNYCIVLFCSLFVAVHFTRCQDDATVSLSTPQCNSTVRDGQGFLVSPNFPRLYDSNSFCKWQITVETDRIITLNFRHFDLERSAGCAYDRVSVYDGPSQQFPLLGKFCGAFRPADVITTSNQMLMTFQSDDSTQKTGFIAFFFSVAPQVAGPNSCGGLLTGNSGAFHSVNFPKSNYPNDLTCVWQIRVPENYQIVLHFAKLTLELSANCKYDSVTVYSGSSTLADRRFLGRFCKFSDVPDSIISQGNKMFVTFATDSSGNDVGFSASFTSRLSLPAEPNQAMDPNVTSSSAMPTTASASTEPAPSARTFSTTESVFSTDRTNETEPTVFCSDLCSTSPTTSQAACSAEFGASVKLLSIQNIEPQAVRVRVSLIRMLKISIDGVSSKRKSKFWINVACPECFPSLVKRSKYIIAGREFDATGGHIYPGEDYIRAYNKKLQKTWMKEIRRCQKISRRLEH